MSRRRVRFRRGELRNRPLLGFGQVEFIPHALARMRERKITYDDVYRTVENPDEIGLPTAPCRHRVRWRKTEFVAVDVVYALMDDRVRIITTMRIDLTAEKGVPPRVFRVQGRKSDQRDKQKHNRRKK